MGIAEDIATLDELVKDKQAELNNHKKARDKFQSDMKACQMRRDSFHKNVTALISQIQKLKDERENYNKLTREAKANRDAVRERIDEARANGVRDLGALKEERDAYHRQVEEYYAKSQAVHEQIEKLRDQIDASKNLADEQHAQAIRFKEAADNEHQLFLQCLAELRELQDELPDLL